MATTERRSATEAAPARWLTPTELRTLEAICETLFPATVPPAGEEDRTGFYARPASELHLADLLMEALAEEPPETRAAFRQLLALLHSPLTCMVLAGRPQSFAQLSPSAREAALRALSTHAVPRLRQGFQGIKRLAAFLYYSAPDAQGQNPNWPALGYVPAPPPPAPADAPKPIRPLDVTGDLTLTADVVVIGSGAGGGVVAAHLAAAGKDVLLLEKGGYYNEADFTGSEAEMTARLYLRRGMLSTADLGMVVLAGSALGGGTLVNWSTSLRTPPEVLAEWEREHGLSGASGAEFAHGFALAEQRMGVTTADSAPNRNNAALQRGCEALGYAWNPIPRNATGCEQRCGACGYGCPYGRKQSTLLTFVQDAYQAGARVLVRCTVERVLTEAGQVRGVAGWAVDTQTGERRQVRVAAPLVVVAGGGVESPALLLRSGLSNPNIGRHLRLHPVVALLAEYAEPVEPWVGSLQTVYSEQFARLTGGHGVRFEVMPAHPGLLGLAAPWEGGQAHKAEMARMRHSAVFIVLARDTGAGSVRLDRHGEAEVHYWPNELDRRHLQRGMQEVARIALAGGARRLTFPATPRLVLEAADRASAAQRSSFFEAIERRAIAPNRLLLGTAHQMGTCRLGSSARTAVADQTGAVYGVRGLYIADASGFPTASGVNPMLSTMALAHHVAAGIRAGG